MVYAYPTDKPFKTDKELKTMRTPSLEEQEMRKYFGSHTFSFNVDPNTYETIVIIDGVPHKAEWEDET